MNAGMTYMVVSSALAVLMYFGAKEPHQTREGVDIYRYQSLLVRVIFIGIPGWLLMSGFVYSTYPSGEPSGIGLFIFITINAGITAAFGVLYIFLKKFYIEIDDKSIRIGGIRPERTIAFEAIHKLELTQGSQYQVLSLFDARGRRILKAASTLQDFDDMETLIEQRLSGRGVLMRYREYGVWRAKWTERRS